MNRLVNSGSFCGMNMKKLEICCYTLESALLAEQAGASRIELCDNAAEGGTTPSLGSIQLAKEQLQIPLSVMIRPRGGDFCYSNLEYESMKRDVNIIKDLGGVQGIVFGFLRANGQIDVQRTKEMVELAESMEVTFHRAFDMCQDPLLALEQLKDCGVKRILTSGGRNKAMQGIDLLQQLVAKARDEIIIMPGSGVNESNLEELMTKTKAVEFHSSARHFQKSRMEYTNPNIDMGGEKDSDEYRIISVNVDCIQKMAAMLK
jgi:copper homeostasis protein